jgi:hypothetical protein
MGKNAIRTTHNLDFGACPDPYDSNVVRFKIGTCHGQYFSTPLAFCILSIINDKPGNGHLTDVWEWFEYACRRDKRILMVCEFMNDRFKEHCIQKRGFFAIPGTNDIAKVIAP